MIPHSPAVWQCLSAPFKHSLRTLRAFVKLLGSSQQVGDEIADACASFVTECTCHAREDCRQCASVQVLLSET